MKKGIILSIFSICYSISFGQGETPRLQVVASASMIADIAQNIIGDHHEISMIVPIGGDPHLHEPTPSNARQVARSDLILINGLTFEGWITELIENSGTKGKIVTVSEGIDVLTSSIYENSADPHAWMDASNGIIYARNIRDAITTLDPGRREVYADNFKAYKNQLEILDAEILKSIQTIPEDQRVLITSHDAFQYYGRRYGIQLEAIMGISTEAEAQTADIIRVNKVIRENKVPALFIESTINPKLIEQLAKDNNVSIGGSLYADSLGDENSKGATYIDMLRYNTRTITQALKKTNSQSQPGTESDSSNSILYSVLIGIFLLVTVGMFLKMRS